MCSEISAKAANGRAPSCYYYVNVSEVDHDHRSWDDMREFGFVSAGGGRRYSDPLDKLKVGQKIFVYQKLPHRKSARPRVSGYVGYGEVTSAKVPAVKFKLEDGSLLIDQDLTQPGMDHESDDEDRREYAVGVSWKKAFSSEAAVNHKDLFRYRQTACKLKDAETIEFLEERFGVR